MHILIVYNARPVGLARTDPELEKSIEGDEWPTIQAIGTALEHHNHQVSYLPVDINLYHNLKNQKDQIDLIFNLSEGLSHAKDREAHLPFMAEILGIPYTGPSPLSSALILDKSRAKQIWTAHSLPTAQAQLYPRTVPLSQAWSIYPAIVKPNSDGSGIGIHHTSIVHNNHQLKKAILNVHHTYHQDALVENYLPGREFTVSVIGNDTSLTVLPIIEINFAGLPQDAPPIDSYEAKFVYGATGVVPMDQTELCPAPLTNKLRTQIETLAKDAYLAIGCRDFGRLDIRLDAHGIPHLLEINHPPGLMSDPEESSFFTISARTYGWDFDTLINNIITTATHRLHFSKKTT